MYEGGVSCSAALCDSDIVQAETIRSLLLVMIMIYPTFIHQHRAVCLAPTSGYLVLILFTMHHLPSSHYKKTITMSLVPGKTIPSVTATNGQGAMPVALANPSKSIMID